MCGKLSKLLDFRDCNHFMLIWACNNLLGDSI
jgi:hypothetical protein